MGTNSFPKTARLSGRTTLSLLFAKGDSGFVYPYRYIFSIEKLPEESTNPQPVSVLVSVPKKYHKRANKRNLLKRRTREVFRTGSHELRETSKEKGVRISLALIYSSKEILEYTNIENAVGKIFRQIGERI